MGKKEDNEKAYGEGKADREAGKSNKTDRYFEEAIVSVVTGGVSDHLPPHGKSEKDKSYDAGYREKDKK